MKKITERWLRKHGACKEKRKTFRELFGKEAEVSYENFQAWTRHPENEEDLDDDIRWLLGELFFYTDNTHRDGVAKRLMRHLKMGDYHWVCLTDIYSKFKQMSDRRATMGIVQVLWQA